MSAQKPMRTRPTAQWIESIGEGEQNLDTLNAYISVYTKLKVRLVVQLVFS